MPGQPGVARVKSSCICLPSLPAFRGRLCLFLAGDSRDWDDRVAGVALPGL
jgi:hypothetical protein